MTTLYTIGYTQKNLKQFVRVLQEAEVDAIIDIRLRNTSQLAGFSKRDDLAFLLGECFGIAYEHRPELAPTPEILDAFKAKGETGPPTNRDSCSSWPNAKSRTWVARSWSATSIPVCCVPNPLQSGAIAGSSPSGGPNT